MTETLPQLARDQNGLGPTNTVITTDYDGYGRVHDVIDADGYTTTYDATGAVTKAVPSSSITPNATITTSSVPDLLGRPVQTTDGNDNTTTIQYVDGLLQ